MKTLINLSIVLLSLLISTDVHAQSPSDAFSLEFEIGADTSSHKPWYSPKGTKIFLKKIKEKGVQGFDHLQGEFVLGRISEVNPARTFLVARSAPKSGYDLLILDRDHDGNYADETPIKTIPKENRGKTWSSFKNVHFEIFHRINGTQMSDDYEVGFWIAVENVKGRPEIIRFSRKGFKEARVMIEGKEHTVTLSDSDNNGIFDQEDWWSVRPADVTERLRAHRKINDYFWCGGKAWKLRLHNETGQKGLLESFDPGITEEEDTEIRKPILKDVNAPKADKPIQFGIDYKTVKKSAESSGKYFFMKFEATWCRPCKMMDKYVYSSQPVVDVAHNIQAVKVDVDINPRLKKKLKVESLPTGILFSPDGKEIKRFVGYQSVVEMESFFGATQK